MFKKKCEVAHVTHDSLQSLILRLEDIAQQDIALSLHLRELLMTAAQVLYRVRQALLLSASDQEEPLVLRQLRAEREYIRQLSVALESVSLVPADDQVRQTIRTAIHQLFTLQTLLCETCGGRGQVGGWDGSGYDGQDCPDCQGGHAGASPRSSALALVQALSLMERTFDRVRTSDADVAELYQQFLALKEAFDGPSVEVSLHLPLKLPHGAILVGRAELSLVMNALQRDAEKGLTVRGEILEMLQNGIARLDQFVA